MKIMKKYGILLFGLVWAWQSCQKIDRLTQFDLTYHSEVTIPASIPLNVPFDIVTPEITTNTEEDFENHQTHKDLIEEISLKEVELTITDPAGADFDFLNSIEIYIETDDLPAKKIAWKENIPENGARRLRLETSSDDIKEYLLADSFKLKIKTKTDRVLTQDVTIDIKTVFHVDAKILGI